MTTRKLGTVQASVLRALVEHKRWYRGAGWIWDNNSNTEKLLDSLVKRGLVTITEETFHSRLYPSGSHVEKVYRPVVKEGE